jgi:hypothetical protein
MLRMVGFYFYSQQYYFLAILVPRLVHDATAYVFYVTHDYNKHHSHPGNGGFYLEAGFALSAVYRFYKMNEGVNNN